LTINEDQVVGLVFERLLNYGDGHDLRMDLNNFFNQELKFPHMLAAKLRADPRFRSKEAPEKRIFRTRDDANAEAMYPFTKVTWDPDDYARLEPAIRVIEKPLTEFLSLLCQETTFKFQEEYDAELEYKLAELKVEARLKKQATLSAAAATAKALEQAKRATPESVQKTMDKMDRKMTQIQRTQQRQGERNKTTPTPSANHPKPPPKNSHGGRGKGPSVAPQASNNGSGNGNRRNPRQRNDSRSPKTGSRSPKTDSRSPKTDSRSRQNKRKLSDKKSSPNKPDPSAAPKRQQQKRQRPNKQTNRKSSPQDHPAPESHAASNNAADVTTTDAP
jgi:hypothetical protein